MEDLIEKALVLSESNDQLESTCRGFKDLVFERKKSNSFMHVSHWTPTLWFSKLSFWRMCMDY